jgi:hypothetical protein
MALLSQKRWRKNLLVGALIASTGVVGLWAIAEYAVDLQKVVFKTYFEKTLPPDQIKPAMDSAITKAYLLQMLGAAAGMTLFTRIAALGRKLAFGLGFSAALVVTFLVYWKMSSPADAYWMMPLMGMAQLSVFAGFAIYLPFIIIDAVVASVLMSMGMMMLPPAMISLPFKLLLFVLVDGWTLTITSLVQSFK